MWCKRASWLHFKHLLVELYKCDGSRYTVSWKLVVMTIVFVPMTGLNNYYFSVPSIILIEDLPFICFYRQIQKCFAGKCQFLLIYSKLLVFNPSVIKSV